MAYRDLRAFISLLEKRGLLKRITAEVEAELEITEITDRICKTGGPALFFEKVKGYQIPAVTNLFGSLERVKLALEVTTLDEIGPKLVHLFQRAGQPLTFLDKLKALPQLAHLASLFPKIVKDGPCKEIIIKDNPSLKEFPILKCWPEDKGPFITLPLVFTKDAVTKQRNVGMYRMQVFSSCTTGMHWHIHKDGSHYFQEYRKAGKRMEVAVAIGTDPAVTYAATAPMPRGVDELLLAGFIRQEPVRMVKALTVDIRVPAKAEFILEGYIDPEETRIEGPFGDHTGYYSLEGEYPVFHVTALTHRRNPVYSTTIVGRPPMEDCYLAYATERIFLPLLRTILPEIEDYTLPWEGVFHNIVVAVLDKEFPGHAAKVMSGLWGTGQMSFAKAVVLIDDKSLLSRREDLLRHILDTIDFQSDILLTEGILDVLDHSAPQGLYGTKIGIDATSRIAGETARPARPTSFETLSEFSIRARLQEIAPGVTSLRVLFPNTPRPLMILAVKKEGERNSKYYLDLLQKEPLFRGILVIYDSDIDLANDSLLLWKAFNNVDPGRDIRIVRWGAMLDATRKGPQDGHHREWPDDIVMSENIVQLVNEKFPEIGKK